MINDTQSRKWQITLNNPLEKGFIHDRIKNEISQIKPIVYFCMSDEIGLDKETPHTHVFVACSSAVRFSTIKNHFPDAHIEQAKGTSQQNRDYVFKLGKWENDKKHGTQVANTGEEWGEMPVEQQGARKDLAALYDMIKSGMSNFEIMDDCPNHMFNIDKIEKVRQTIKENENKDSFRKLSVSYISGKTETGKTRSVLEKYGYSNVYRVTDYDHPFDSYKGQKVIVFDEFRSSLRIQDMLNYLDGYPLELPCRYSNKVACYSEVYIISNITLEEQYQHIQISSRETWQAFLRRINVVLEYTDNGIKNYSSANEYFNRFIELDEDLGVF